MDIVLSWIADCRDCHPSCQREHTPGESRKFARLIDVGKVQDLPTVRLCPTQDISQDAPYITLSHCWGGAEIPTLKQSTHSQYHEAISLADLPQTFKDAIQLTRRLGIQYLWIDSLGILQDSDEDWLGHAGLMNQIYQGSFCNIAATSSPSPFGGLFVERDPTLLTPFRVLVKGALSENKDGFYDVGGDFSQDWTSQVTMSPLGRRAWVVQERLLAPRVVHFAKSKLFWERT